MKLRELLQWLLKLLPKQKMQDVGHGNVQVGRVDGDLCSTQNSNNQTVYNTYFVMAAQTSTKVVRPMDNATTSSAPTSCPRPSETTDFQRDLLRFMAQSPFHESRAEYFMQREFGTVWVKSLDELQCRRTTRYVETCIRNEQDKMAVENNLP